MSIENYTDREIALQARVAELEAALTKAQDELHCTEESLEAASCALPEKYNEKFSNGFECMGDFAQELGIAFTSEISDLRQQLSEAQAQIEASRKQEAWFWYRPRSNGSYEGPVHDFQLEQVRKECGAWVPLFGDPVVAQDVLKAAQDILRKEAMGNVKHEIRSALHFSIHVLENAKTKSMGCANGT